MDGSGQCEVGIVIVHFNAEALLERCICSLQESDFTSFNALVVDNGSSRDLSWVERDPRFRVLESPANVGFASATNAGLDLLPDSAPFVLILNPDVVLEPNTLSEMVRVMEANEALGAATCRLILPSGRIDPACRRSEPTLWSSLSKQVGLSRLAPGSRLFGSYNLAHLDPARTHPIDAGTGAFLLIRRSALEACGGKLDERFFLYGEDLDLCRRLREAGYPLLYCPSVSAVHYKGSRRIRSAWVTVHFYRAMWLYYRKWGRFGGNPFVLAPLLAAILLLGSLEVVSNELKRRFWNEDDDEDLS
jgi:GT2 family glycosyltransferase